MASFCLPKRYSAVLLRGLRDGSIDTDRLSRLSSSERREFFSEHLGPENAKEVNTLFEGKLLLPNQKKAMTDWVRQVAGLDQKAQADIVQKIQGLKTVLNPTSERAFLSDLAHKRLGAEVSADEARLIYSIYEKARDAKVEMLADPGNEQARITYGRSLIELADTVNEMKGSPTFDFSTWKHYLDTAGNILNIPKTVLSSADLSAPFIQGRGLIGTKQFWQAYKNMFSYFWNEENYQNLRAWIVTHPDFELAKSSKLGITEVGDKITQREEAFQSNLVEKFEAVLGDKVQDVTGVNLPRPFRASARGFTGFLNYLRFSRFSDLIRAAKEAGIDVHQGSQAAKDIAEAVNIFTGRGHLGPEDTLANAGPILNGVLFSPRKMVSDIEMFNPITYARLTGPARIAAIKQLTSSLIVTGTLLELGHLAGADISVDPTSTDFLKLKFGDWKYDLTGGSSIYARLWARILLGKTTSTTGNVTELNTGKFGSPTKASLVMDYIRGKLAPLASAMANYLSGSDMIGQPFSIEKELQRSLVPMTMGSIVDYFNSSDTNTGATMMTLASIFGINMTPPTRTSREGVTFWGEPEGSSNKLDQPLTDLGYNPNFHFPPQTINGVKLTDKQYKQYIIKSGMYSKQFIEPLIEGTSWNQLPNTVQLRLIQENISSARKLAQSEIMAESIGSDNDVMQKSLETKLKKAQQ